MFLDVCGCLRMFVDVCEYLWMFRCAGLVVVELMIAQCLVMGNYLKNPF